MKKNAKTKIAVEKTITKKSTNNFEEFEKKLLEMKKSIEKVLADKKEFDLVENEIGDQIDEAGQSLDKEVIFEQSDNERKILNEINAALRKLKNGTYGKCEQCGIEIENKRLKAVPYSRYCIKCQIKNDKYL
jgi:DnaK suppressor protein